MGAFIKRISLFVVFLTFALSSLGTTIIFPILAPLFLGSADTILRGDIPEHIRSILFGVFLAAFPLAQFLIAPLVGEYSDRKGRKKAFLGTLFLECLGFFLSAVGIRYQHLSLLFIGRFITGLGAGNLSICLATLSDVAPNEGSRGRYFSYGSAVAGVMFVLGPFLGGKLSDTTLASFFSLDFPLWIGAFLAAINLLMVAFFFKETLLKAYTAKLDPVEALHNVQHALHSEKAKNLYLLFFFFLFSWNMLYQFLPALIVQEFNGTSALIGNLSALMGIVWFFGTITLSFLLHHLKKEKGLLLVVLFLLTVIVLFIPYPKTLTLFMELSALAVFFFGGLWPVFMKAISKQGAKGSQGKILGVSQSIQSLSMLLAPFLGGFFLQAHSKVPFIIGASSLLIAAFFLRMVKWNHDS